MATYSSILDWEIPLTDEPSRLYRPWVQFSSVAQSCLTLRPHELQHAKPPCPSPTSGVHSDLRPSSQWCHPAISSSVVPFTSCPQSLPASSLFQWVNSSHEVAKVLEFHLQHQSFQWMFTTDCLQDRLVGSPCRPRDFQESSPTPQFKSTMNSLALSLLCSPAYIHTWPLEKP